MAKLIAQGPDPKDHWEQSLPADQSVVLGRDCGSWSVPWEKFISREHVELCWRNAQLEVQKVPDARNPIFMRGQALDCFRLKPGEHFVIGDSTFTLAVDQESTRSPDPAVIEERAISAHELRRMRYRDAPHRIDVLNRLPDVIGGARDDIDLSARLVNMLLAGITRADGIALLAVEATGQEKPAIRELAAEQRRANVGPLQPSQRLVREAVRRQQTVLQVWGSSSEPPGAAADFTQAGNVDWAFCTPVPGAACRGWAIYVAGTLGGEGAATIQGPWETNELGDDLKFSELVAAILSSLRQVNYLQRHQASLSHFFSPAVSRTLAEKDPDEVLKPRETEVTVLFCDLRGFSRESEKRGSDLLALLRGVSQSLGHMTQNILDWGGVIGDFHGDAAMGFWGWPIKQSDMVLRACMAALGIRLLFEAIHYWPNHPLADFKVGMGLATGRAVAGKIGTTDQVKITVFGPIVNLASRLEGMTKILRAPILMDENTARIAKEQISPTLARQRRVAKVRPYGLDTPLIVSELLPPLLEYEVLTDEHLAAYEAAFDAFLERNWDKTLELLHRLPPEDRVKDFLTVFIAKNDRTPPPDWTGVIALESKT